MSLSRFISITVALALAASVTMAAQKSGDKDSGKKSDGVVTDTATATGKKSVEIAKATGSTTKKGAKATAGGAKKLGLGIKDAVTPGKDDKDKDKEKKK